MVWKKPLAQIKQGTFARTAGLARLTLTTGAKAAGMAIGNLFRDEQGKAEASLKMLQEQLAALTHELGQLKGSAMKVGQMLSMYGEYFLPPQANALLKSLQSQSPPLAWESIAKVLQEELGAEKLSLLTIDPEPYAAASLGQVHTAIIKATQEKVAVKVQYPGVEQAISADLRAISGMLTLSKILPRKLDQKGFFAEVKMMLEQEADYRIELAYTQNFQQWLAEDPRFVVPKVYPNWCTQHVMCTQFEEGISPDSEIVRALPQQRRNALGYAILDLYMKEVWQLQHVQTDPHFGNYLLRLGDDTTADRLVLLDFGAVRRVPDLMLTGYRSMVVGTLHQQRQEVLRGGIELGFLSGHESERTHDLFYQLCTLICEPFMQPDQVAPEARHLFHPDGAYKWGESDLPKRLALRGAEAALTVRLQAPPREAIFLDRKLSGVFIFLNKLQASIRGIDVLRQYLPEI